MVGTSDVARREAALVKESAHAFVDVALVITDHLAGLVDPVGATSILVSGAEVGDGVDRGRLHSKTGAGDATGRGDFPCAWYAGAIQRERSAL